MYCKNCGMEVDPKARFCSNCGAKIEHGESGRVFGEPPSEPQKNKKEGNKTKKKFHVDDFNWDLDGYPTGIRHKTEDVNFNWDSVLEKKERNRFAYETARGHKTDEKKAGSQKRPAPEKDSEKIREKKDAGVVELSFENEILGDLYSKEPGLATIRARETAELTDKFYAFDSKKAEFQSFLDAEYNRIQRGEEKPEEESKERPWEPAEGRKAPAEQEFKAEDKETAKAGPAAALSENSMTEKAPATKVVGVSLARSPRGILIIEKSVMRKNMEKNRGDASGGAELSAADEEPSSESSGTGAAEKAASGLTAASGAKKKKLSFSDVFSENGEDNGEPEKKKGGALKVIAIILCILVICELVMIGIQYLAPDTAAARRINSVYNTILDRFLSNDGQQTKKSRASAEVRTYDGVRTADASGGSRFEEAAGHFPESFDGPGPFIYIGLHNDKDEDLPYKEAPSSEFIEYCF